jgi:hypothetical protein
MIEESQLNPIHFNMVQQYLDEVKNKTANSYMLTIARDGESPVRTIIFYTNAIEAAEAYNKYKDWGFAKQYLTVKLYEPNGVINEKVLKRNQAGECTFVRQDYIEAEKILCKAKNYIEEEAYVSLVKDFMVLFAKDSWRFDPDRFLKECGIFENATE